MLPSLVLGTANVERRPTDLSQFDIMIAQQKLTLGVTHWCGTVATATGLMKHYRTMVILDFFDQLAAPTRLRLLFSPYIISGLVARNS